MKYPNRILIIISFFILGGACEKELAVDIDSEINQQMQNYDIPSLSTCIISDNKIVWQNNYGYSDSENQVNATDETVYHIGSISKLFIATAIMQLEEKGLLKLEEDINNYLPVSIRNPFFPENSITPKNLMSHTAGIAWPQYYEEALGIWHHFEPDKAPSLSEWIPQYLIPSGIHYNPKIWKQTQAGSFELYSNIGSCVLAYIVEHISGMNYEDYCMEYIFSPLGMESTSYRFSDLDQENIALLYDANQRVNPFYDVRISASGSLMSTVPDLSRFLIAYLNGGELDGFRLLKASSIDRLFEIQNPISGIGLIWRNSFGGWIGHTGALVVGSSSILEIHPESKTGYIILCNKYPGPIAQGTDINGLVTQKVYEYIL